MRSVANLVWAAVLLSGCGAARQAELQNAEAGFTAQHDSAISECERQHPGKSVAKPIMPFMQCVVAAKRQKAVAVDSLYGTNEAAQKNAAFAQVLVLAERYDAGRMTAAEYEAEVARTNADYMASAQSRQNAIAQTRAAQYQAAAAQSQAAMAQQRAIQDAFNPRSTTCTTFGSSTTCR